MNPTTWSRRRVLSTAWATGLGPVVLPFDARAQAARWKPSRPISLYNPFPAGGSTDVHLRFLAERVGKILGQQVLVDVKAGAAGTLAPAALVHSAPDGHTIACYTINSLRYPHYQSVNWHPLRDFSFITGLSSYTFGLVVRADSPWKSVEDLVAAGRSDPDKHAYGTSGIGGSGHLMMIEIEQARGAKFNHVPYKGGAEWMQALIGGQIQFVADASAWGPFVDDGRCRLLGLATEQRLPKFSQVPTLRERGIDVVGQSPYGLVGPKDLPGPIAQSLHDAFTEATNEPGMQPLLDRFNQVPWRRDPAEYRRFAEDYFAGVRPLLVKAGLAKG
jgi:tripartite-type tricarboxylate transporter receptor subunit TctC